MLEPDVADGRKHRAQKRNREPQRQNHGYDQIRAMRCIDGFPLGHAQAPNELIAAKEDQSTGKEPESWKPAARRKLDGFEHQFVRYGGQQDAGAKRHDHAEPFLADGYGCPQQAANGKRRRSNQAPDECLEHDLSNVSYAAASQTATRRSRRAATSPRRSNTL